MPFVLAVAAIGGYALVRSHTATNRTSHGNRAESVTTATVQMAVILPAGHINVSREPHRGWYREKVAWWVDVPGALHITARRLDRYSATLGHGDVAPPAPTGAHRIEPTNVLFPVPGCGQVAGGVGSDLLTWIFRARA